MKLLLLCVLFGLLGTLVVAQWGGYQQQGNYNPFVDFWNNVGGGGGGGGASSGAANAAQTGNSYTGGEG
ncbi:unnamed protein product [Bursaphelenchus xylophilus]|nr:unnamed protein product [Bursaphelenchus xylophilus]CAG9113228.1 unnamed protein product [Bursaphelenchus xylophilus]